MSPVASLAHCRLIVDGPATGAWQMAVDEALLESAAAGGPATLRFYEWSEPTLSLGYFQNFRQRELHPPSQDCAVVRRLTGGGAILHDRELTYSLALPLAHPLAVDPTRIYDAAHETLVAVLAGLGVSAQVLTGPGALQPGGEPFLCFERRSEGDVVQGAYKICGSAQRRRRGAILQHGSLLLTASDHAPHLKGINDLLDRGTPQVRIDAVRGPWQQGIAVRLALSLEPAKLTELELDRVRALTLEKYSGESWTRRR